MNSSSLLLVFLLICSCGKSYDLRTNNEQPVGRPAMQATISYTQKSADILILRDKQLSDSSFGRSDTSFSAKITAAAGPFAARLKWSKFDVNVGVVEVSSSYNSDDNISDPKFAQILDGNGPAIIKNDTPDLAKLLADRLLPTESQNSYYSQSSQPLVTLRKTLGTTQGQTKEFFRPGARLSVIFILNNPPIKEQASVDDIAKQLDAKYGSGNWTVSAAFNEEATCSPANANAIIAPPYTEEELEKPRFEMGQSIRKLVTRSKGLMLSTCAASLSPFLDTVTLMSGGPQYVPVLLGKKAMWDSIDVKFQGKSLQGWRYEIGSNVLQVPTTIPSGSSVAITFEEDHGQRPNVSETSGSLYEQPAPEDERSFYSDINDTLSSYCGSCHGAGGQQLAFVDNFSLFKNNKAKILDRIGRPESDPLHMPKAGSSQLSESTLKALTAQLGE